MKRLLLAATMLIACGDNDIDHVCGMGTHDEGGVCVADDSSSCAAGTILQDGMCVPDGSVVCSQGTKFDPATGKCVLDPTACADGTVLVGDMCVPDDDTLADMADHKEGAEPNDGNPNVAGMFAAPAIGGKTTFYGCVTATEDSDGDGNLDADLDAWVVTANAPMVLDVTTDGIHGLSAGFVAINGSAALSPALDNWQRYGLNLTGDTSQREIFLPAAGTYVLFVTDSRSLFLGQAGAGTPKTCYFGTVKQVAMPAATALTIPQTAATNNGHVQLFTFTGTATGDIVDLTMNSAAPAMQPAFIALRSGTLQRSAAVIAGALGDTPPFDTVGGLDTGTVVSFVVDPEYNYGLVPQAYTLDAYKMGAQALPTTGTSVTATKHNGATPTATYVDSNYFYFDVPTAGQIVHFNLTSTVAAQMRILGRDIFTPAGALDTVASINTGSGVTTFNGQYVRFPRAGRYYFVTVDPAGTASDTYMVTSTLTDMATTVATYGTEMPAQVLTPQGATFYSLDIAPGTEWTEFGIPAATDFGTNPGARITIYDLAGSGWLNNNYAAVQTGTQPFDGSPSVGRIVLDDPRDYLIRVEDTATPGAAPTFTLDVEDRGHVSLGTITAGTPINRTGMDNVPAGLSRAYLIKGAAADRLRVQATPIDASVDIRIDRRSASEGIIGTADTGAAGAAEVTSVSFATSPTWVAFTVTNKSTTTATGVDLAITATAPIAFADICPSGTVLPMPFNGMADDQYTAVQTLPAGFMFYGAAVSDFIIGANGFLVFGTTNPTCSFGCYSNLSMPSTSQPQGGIVAPYWDDQDTIKVCRKDDSVANTVTIQWTGNLYTSTTKVQYQAILHQNGAIDFVYGPNHQANGSSATIGVENAAGTAAQQLSYNTAGGATPNSSYSLTTP